MADFDSRWRIKVFVVPTVPAYSTMVFASLKIFPACLIFLVDIFAVTANSAPVVDLGYARYQGVVDPELNITSYLGIRYAAPPIGK
jgi:hypothetical protein